MYSLMFLKAKNQEIQKEKKITIVYIKNRLDNFLKKEKNYYKIFNFKFSFGFCSFMYSKRKVMQVKKILLSPCDLKKLKLCHVFVRFCRFFRN